MVKALVVIPCYNEALRFRAEEFCQLGKSIDLLFVNDGSTDATADMIKGLQTNCSRIDLKNLPKNVGKAEAVRQGLLEGLRREYQIVGYADADLATPPTEILRLVETLTKRNDVKVVLGSRIKMLGVDIQRRGLRHYLGRLFATFASLVLNLPVYDTQCGAKFFRATDGLQSALSTPFHSRWVFDVELINRLLYNSKNAKSLVEKDFLEVPLQRWTHMKGSKLRPSAMILAILDLFLIWLRRP